MRAASPELKARLAEESTTLCRLWRVTRRDGTVLRFTDSVRPVTITVAPDGSQTYRSDISFTSSAIFTSKSFANQQSVTMSVVMDALGFVEGDLRSRLYDGATGEVFVCDYEFPSYGVVSMFDGVFGQIILSDKKMASIELTPSQSAINGTAIGTEKYSQTCRASLGDARCKVDLDALKVAFTVDSAAGGSVVSSAITQDAAHWALGFVKWLTGDNVGTQSLVQSNDPASTSFFLLAAPFYPVAAGDTGYIYPGCDKLRATCLDKFNNVLNMRAEPDVPDGAGIPGSNYTNTHAPIGVKAGG